MEADRVTYKRTVVILAMFRSDAADREDCRYM
jgi:hypothetical protein